MGSGDEHGELVQAIERGEVWEELISLAKKFDYLPSLSVGRRFKSKTP